MEEKANPSPANKTDEMAAAYGNSGGTTTDGGEGGPTTAYAQRLGKALAAGRADVRNGAEGFATTGGPKPSWVTAMTADPTAGWSGGDARRSARHDVAPEQNKAYEDVH